TRKHRDHEHTGAAVFHGDANLVIASSVDEAKAALDVLDGKAASAAADGPLAGNVPPGTTVLFRATDISKVDLKCCNSKVAKQTESFRFVTGEHEGQSFYRSRSTMTNDAVVGQLKE